jgi:MFS family permease
VSRFSRLARNHDFTVLWVGGTISDLGSWMSMFVFPLLAYALTGSTVMAALAETFHLLGMAAALLPAGMLADRVDRRRLMRISSGSGVLLYASLVVAVLTDVLTTPHLFAVALLTGVGEALFGPAEISAIRSIVDIEELPTAMSQQQARRHIAALVGAPLGGALYAVSRSLPFVVDAVTYAVTWFMLGRVRADLSAPTSGGPRRRPRQEIAEGLAFIWRHPFLRVQTLWASLTNLVVNALFFAAVLRLIQGGFPPLQIGLVEAAAGVLGLLGALAAPALIERFATGWLTVAVSWSFVPLVVPMALFNNPAVVALALGVGLFLNPAGNAGIGAYRLAITPVELQGRTMSTMQFVAMVAMPLAPVLAGALLGWLGGARAIAVLGVLTACVALIPTLSTTIRSVPRPAVWRADGEAVLPAA